MNFKSPDQLIARVSALLDSFQVSGLLDEGEFYRLIKEVLTTLNISSYSPVHIIEEIEGNSMPVPSDMYQLWGIWRYEGKEIPSVKKKNLQAVNRFTVTKECYDNCGDVCEPEPCDNDRNMIIKYWHEGEYIPERKYLRKKLLTVKNFKVNSCADKSPSKYCQTEDQVTTDGKNFYFNFSGGAIYLQYYKLETDNQGLPMIPDVTQIERAIETYIIYRFFQKMYYNNVVDAQQRMREAQQDYLFAMGQAEKWVRLPSFKSMYEMVKVAKRKYKFFEV